MRRYYRPLLVIILLLAISIWFIPQLWHSSQQQLEQLKSKHQLDTSKTATRIIYPLDQQTGVNFAIPEHSPIIRIITNAHIAPVANIPSDAAWTYSLKYQLLDVNKEVLQEHIYHQRTRLTTYQNLDKKRYYANYYASDKTLVLDGRMIFINLHAFKEAAFIRVQLNTIHPDVEGVALRIYAPVKISAHRMDKLWARLSPKQRDNLAKGSVFPADLLSEQEKINLLKNQWQPLGPLGIKGRDYDSKTLYTLKDIGEDKIEPKILLAGLQANANHPAIIPIPEQGGEVALEFKSLDGSPLPKNMPVYLRWYGRTQKERWQQEAVYQSNTSLSYPFQGGLLEVRPFGSVIVKAYLHNSEHEKLDITPEPLRVKTYLTDAEGVDFKISASNTQAAPVRVDVRRLFTPEYPPQIKPAVLNYQWLNAQKQVLQTGVLNISSPPSVYDRLKSIQEPEKISEPQSYYWLLPANVAYLRFQSSQPNLAVNAYNQPLGLMKYTKIPENAYISLDKKDWRPSWFPLAPENKQQLSIQQKVLWIAAQYHPPEQKEDVLAGDYLWNEYLPEKPYQAHYLLEPYLQDNNKIRDEALSSFYCELNQPKNTRLKLQAPKKLRNFRPDLWFLSSNRQAHFVSVNVDGKQLINQSVSGQQNRLNLPNLNAGVHQFSLKPYHSGRWLINNMPECLGKRYLKRRVFKLKTPLKFIYHHQGQDAVLSARLYTQTTQTQRSLIKVNIQTIQTQVKNSLLPTQKWTFQRRLYDIRPSKGEESEVFYASKRLTSGESFFIPFNHDLPIGTYQVTLSHESDNETYLTLAQIVAGSYESRRFYKEVQFEN